MMLIGGSETRYHTSQSGVYTSEPPGVSTPLAYYQEKYGYVLPGGEEVETGVINYWTCSYGCGSGVTMEGKRKGTETVNENVLSCGKSTSTIDSYSRNCGLSTSTIESYSLNCGMTTSSIENYSMNCGKIEGAYYFDSTLLSEDCANVITSIQAVKPTQVVSDRRRLNFNIKATYLDGHTEVIAPTSTNYNASVTYNNETVTISYTGKITNSGTTGTLTTTSTITTN